MTRRLRATASVLAGVLAITAFGGGVAAGPRVVTEAARHSATFGSGSARSWMSPAAERGDLLYVSDLKTAEVDVFSYPGGTLVGKLVGFTTPEGECVDKAGDVFVTDPYSSTIQEYAHGGTAPILTLSPAGYLPNGCAVDPRTGALAVTENPFGSAAGGLLLYRHVKGTPTVYSIPNIFRPAFDGYDSNGNLYVDGVGGCCLDFELAELPAGGHAFSAITVNVTLGFPGAVQWDGTYLAIGDQGAGRGPSKIDRFSISGSAATEVGTTPLSDSCEVLQFWIDHHRVVAGNLCTSGVKYFAYPAGGNSTKTIGDDIQESYGVTISKAR